MVVEKGKVVSIHYSLKDDTGLEIDSSIGGEPFEYVHGSGYLLPKLEEEITGKQIGQKFTAVLEPKDAYGEYDESLVTEIPRSNFATDADICEGMQFQGAGNIVTVKSVGPDVVTVDANHQLAGKTLHFDVEVVSVREATEKELNMGLTGGGCGDCGSCGGGCSGCGGGCGGDCGCGS